MNGFDDYGELRNFLPAAYEIADPIIDVLGISRRRVCEAVEGASKG